MLSAKHIFDSLGAELSSRWQLGKKALVDTLLHPAPAITAILKNILRFFNLPKFVIFGSVDLKCITLKNTNFLDKYFSWNLIYFALEKNIFVLREKVHLDNCFLESLSNLFATSKIKFESTNKFIFNVYRKAIKNNNRPRTFSDFYSRAPLREHVTRADGRLLWWMYKHWGLR